MQQGGADGKEWMSSRDPLVRESHVALDGQKIALGANFTSPVTGASGPGPGNLGDPAEDIQCRCVLLPVRDGLEGRSFAPDEQRRVMLWQQRDARRMTHERAYGRAIVRGFNAQRRAALEALRAVAITEE